MIQISKFFPEISDLYYATEGGEIYSTWIKRALKPTVDKYGYHKVYITGKDGKKYNRYIHRLVLGCFKPHSEMSVLIVNHIDGNKTRNELDNLEWNTIEENNQHALDNNLNGKTGEENPNSKLTRDNVKSILSIHEKEPASVVANTYGVSTGTIYNIRNHRTWRKEIQEIKKELAEERSTTKSR